MKFIKNMLQEVKKHKWEYLLVAVFIFVSAIIRFTPILTGNFPFLFDHGRDMLDVRKIVVDHKLTLIGPFTGLQGIFQSPLHYYLLSIPFIISNGHPAGGTFFVALLGLLGVFLCYFLWGKLLGKNFALLFCLFFAIAPASIAFSQHFWNPHWIPFVMILFCFFLYKSVFEDNDKNWLWAGLCAGIVAQFEIAFGMFLWPVLFLSAILLKRNAFKKKEFWLSLVIYLLTFTPQLLFDTRHGFLMTKTVINFLHGTNQGTDIAILFPQRLQYRINEIQQATIFSLTNNTVLGYFFFAVTVIYALFSLIKKKFSDLKIIIFFLIAPVWFFLIFLLYSHNAWDYYWIGLWVPYCVLVAFVLSKVALLGKPFTGGVLVLVVVWALMTVNTYNLFNRVDDPGPGIFKNEMRVIDFIYHDANEARFSEFVYTPPIYDYAYQYLFWWRGKTLYHYIPEKNKNGIFYLIIESDKEHPLASKGWKETVIKTGKVAWDKTFPGNIIVEKRIGN